MPTKDMETQETGQYNLLMSEVGYAPGEENTKNGPKQNSVLQNNHRLQTFDAMSREKTASVMGTAGIKIPQDR